MRRGAAAWGMALTLVSGALAETPAAEKALATELIAQADDAARERWLTDHRTQLTPSLGRELGAQALAIQKSGRMEAALPAFALAVRVGEITGDLESRITGLRGQGEIERLRGRAQEALPFLERGMREAEAAGDQASVGTLSSPLGTAHIQMGDYGQALEIFERQRAAFAAAGDAKGRGHAESNIGIALGTMGRNEEALEAFERSRDLLEAASYPQGVARAYNNLGLTERNLGNYTASLEALSRSLKMKEELGDRAGLPNTLKNIGDVYQLQGARLQAIEYFHRSYALASELGLKPNMVEALHDEGRTLLELGRTQDAQKVLEQSLALAQEIQSAEAATWISAALAEVYHAQGDGARALSILEGCLETAEHRDEIALVVHTRWEIAGLRLEAGQAEAALPLAERALEMARRYELREELWPALLVAARAQVALGHGDRAEPMLREAVEVIEELRAQTVGPEADRAAFLVTRAAPYQDLIALLADASRDWEALAVAERSKGRVLLDVMGGSSPGAAALDPREREEERILEASLLAANAELHALRLKPSPDPARVKALETRRAERRRAKEDFRTRQYASHPELRVLRADSRPLGKDDVRRLLGEDGHTVLLEYALTDRAAYLFVLGAGPSGEAALAVHRLAIGSGELARLAGDYRERIAARNLDFGPLAARLYEALLAPAGLPLRSARRVILVPDGRLGELPFQALRARGGRYLVEDMAVSYAPSLTVLRDMREQRRASPGQADTLLALGNPALGSGVRRRSPSVLMGDSLEPLPEAEAQVREIARLYDPRNTAVRVGGEARESWLKAEAAHYRVLHLATHGVLDDTSPLYSQLVLAAPRDGESDDGLLEAREILDMHLGADLAVLSACETGRGQAGAGEGLIGMAWAFFVAGCPTTVASQWKVEAASTSRLMLAFHRELRARHTPAEALRLAALTQLRREDQRHPFYWAGFVAMGDADAPPRPAGRTH